MSSRHPYSCSKACVQLIVLRSFKSRLLMKQSGFLLKFSEYKTMAARVLCLMVISFAQERAQITVPSKSDTMKEILEHYRH
jgi:hypothetical protein